MDSTDDFYYPKYIYLNSVKNKFIVASEEFSFGMAIENVYDYEMLFNNPQIEIEQYPVNYPLIAISGEIIDNKYCVTIHNLSKDSIDSLTITITDSDKIIDKVFGKNNKKEIAFLNPGADEIIEFFDISELENRLTISPIVIITDKNKNDLEYWLDKIVIHQEPLQSAIPSPSTGVEKQYYYNITSDIEQYNDVISFSQLKEFIPKEEIFYSEYYISSQVPCAIKFKLKYDINEKTYCEDLGYVIFYNPTSTEREPVQYDESQYDLSTYK